MPVPASGGAPIIRWTPKVIRLARHGCTNRPFYHIVVMDKRLNMSRQVIEQLGTFDSLTNQYNEKLVSLNLERIRYWIGRGAEISTPVGQLLGLSGLLPIHPKCYMQAWRTRKEAETKQIEIAEQNK